MNLAVILLPFILMIGITLTWNFVPSFREQMRGMTTMFEGAFLGSSIYIGIAADVTQEAIDKGWLPENWITYTPFILLLWAGIKRIQTKTPIGQGVPDA